jgi:hypothetical protein
MFKIRIAYTEHNKEIFIRKEDLLLYLYKYKDEVEDDRRHVVSCIIGDIEKITSETSASQSPSTDHQK